MLREVFSSVFDAPRSIQLNAELKLSLDKHDALLRMLVHKLNRDSELRSELAARYTRIDRDLAGYVMHDGEDCIRERKLANGEGTSMPPMRLSLSKSQLEDMVTYILSLIMPDGQIYGAIAPTEKANAAAAFAAYMNHDGRMFAHYDAYKKAIRDSLAYNFGGLHVEWTDQHGVKLSVDENTQQVQQQRGITYSGNALEAADPYNTIIDWSVKPKHLYRLGEFAAVVDRISLDALHRQQYEEKVYGFKDAFRIEYNQRAGEYTYDAIVPNWITQSLAHGGSAGMSASFNTNFYITKPSVRSDTYGVDPCESGADAANTKRYPNQIDFRKAMEDRVSYSASREQSEENRCERVIMYIRLIPKEWGLSPLATFELWKFTIINGRLIARGEPARTAHDFIPIFISTPETDVDEAEAKSQMEYLNPMQDYIAAQLNSHVATQRKKLNGGITIYDPVRIPLGELKDPTHGVVAARPTMSDQPLSSAIHQISDVPDTNNTISEMKVLHDLMLQLNPTQQANQVASLERATQYQAAATVQAGSRRQFTTARIVDTQMLTPCRIVLSTNIMINGRDLKLRIPPFDEETTVTPQQFISENLEFRLSDGLRGLDRVLLTQMAKDVLAATLQSKQAAAQIDVVKMLDWVMRVAGNEVSLEGFRLKSQMDAMPPEVKDAALQLYQQQQMAAQQGGNDQQVPQGSADAAKDAGSVNANARMAGAPAPR